MRLVALATLASAAAAAAVPLVEQQFSAFITQTTYINGSVGLYQIPEGMCPYPNGTQPPPGTKCPARTLNSSMMFNFDVPNQRYREVHTDYDTAYGKTINSTQIYTIQPNLLTVWILQTNPFTGLQDCHTMKTPGFMCPGGKCLQPNVTIDPNAADMGSATLAGEPVENWEATYPQTIGEFLASTREWTVRKLFAEGRNPMLLIENSTDYFGDCFKGTKGNCPAPDVGPCPYHGPCVQSSVRDNTRQLVVGPPPDWMFAKPEGFSCTDITKEEVAALSRPLASRLDWNLDILRSSALAARS